MPPIAQFQLSGTSSEIGYQHGQLAAKEIQQSLNLYAAYFKDEAGLEWSQVRALAQQFVPHLAKDHDDLLDEIKGIALGAGQEWIDIVALNVRSEIGLASPSAATLKPIDGCTAFSWRDTEGIFWSAQNWDWKSSAASSLIALDILAHEPTRRPRIRIMTEAGVIGKIGVNEHGVSILLNALKTNLRDVSLIPIHLLLRRLISLPSVAACISYLASPPVSNRCAAACHILVTDPTESTSIEILPTGAFTRTLVAAASDDQDDATSSTSTSFLSHTNHLRYTTEQTETHLWPDSIPRLSTLDSILSSRGNSRSGITTGRLGEANDDDDDDEHGPDSKSRMMTFQDAREILSDRTLGEKGICRHETREHGDVVTVFSIAIRSCKVAPRNVGRSRAGDGDETTTKPKTNTKAEVVVGRPDEGGQLVEFTFA